MKESHTAAERLKRLRSGLRLSQRELAREFGVTGGAIAQWETGLREVPGPVLKLIEIYEEYLGLEREGTDTSREIRSIASSWAERIVTLAAGPKVREGSRAGTLIRLLEGGLQGAIHKRIGPGEVRRKIRSLAIQRVIESIGEMKGVSLKLAQIVSYFDPGLPMEIQVALGELQNLNPAVAPTVAARVVYEELGESPQKRFAEWSPRPFAVASIGQVHLARLHTGEKVAVKVQHPGIQESIRNDFRGIGMLQAIASLVRPVDRVLLDHVREAVLEECDYVREAANIERFREIFKSRPDIRIPRVYHEHSAKRVLTTEFMEGARLREFLREADEERRRRAAISLFEFEVMSIKGGVLNTDPHDSNFLFGPDSIACLDFGRVLRLSPVDLANHRELMVAVGHQDKERARKAVERLEMVKDWESFDFDEFWSVILSQQRHCIAGQPMRFTHDYIKMTRQTSEAFSGKDAIRVTPEMLWSNVECHGLWWMLAELGVTEDWGQRALDIWEGRASCVGRP